MKTIDFTPESICDLQNIREYVQENFDENAADRVVQRIMNSIENLQVFPESGSDMLAKYGIVSDYLCLFTNRNYVFYRIEEESVKVIRILNEKQDFMNILFDIKTITRETEEYWDE